MPVLPIIDYARRHRHSRQEVVKSLYQALTTSGFFYLKGLEGWNSEELKKLSKYFFSLPRDVKKSISRKMFNKNATHSYRGFFPAQPSEISHKEGFEMGPPDDTLPQIKKTIEERVLLETNQWPTTGNANEDQYFRERMEYYHTLFTGASIEIMRMIAEAWGLESNFFTPMFEPHHLSTFRLLHYPPRGEEPIKEAIDGEYILQCDEHRDSGILTLLPDLNFGGLQIRGPEGEWVNVPNMEGCLIVNIGELLSIMSGRVLKATNHRVVDTGEDRYSCPYFLEPNFHANINIRLPPAPSTTSESSNKAGSMRSKNISNGTRETYPKVDVNVDEAQKYGVWLIRRMSSLYAEFRTLLESA